MAFIGHKIIVGGVGGKGVGINGQVGWIWK